MEVDTVLNTPTISSESQAFDFAVNDKSDHQDKQSQEDTIDGVQLSHVWTNFGDKDDADVGKTSGLFNDNIINITTDTTNTITAETATNYITNIDQGRYTVIETFDLSNILALDVPKIQTANPESVPPVPKQNTSPKRKNSTECREEWRPKIKKAKLKALDIDRKIPELEARCWWIFGVLKEIVGFLLGREDLSEILVGGKKKIRKARNNIIDVVANERIVKTKAQVKRGKTNQSGKREAVDSKMKLQMEAQKALIREDFKNEELRMILENSICSRTYLDKIEPYVECQKKWLETLQNVITKLEDGEKKARKNNAILQELKENLAESKGTLDALNPLGSLDNLGLAFACEKQHKVSMHVPFLIGHICYQKHQVENLLGVAARNFHGVDNIVEFQRRLETFIKTQGVCIKLLREEIVENKNRVTHIKSLLNQINTIDDLKIEKSDPVSSNAGVTDMNEFLSAGPKADDLEESPDSVLSFDAFATGPGDAL